MKQMTQNKSYDLEASVVDEREKCVHVSVNLSSNGKNWIDTDIIWRLSSGLSEKYPELNFTGKWSTGVDKKDYVRHSGNRNQKLGGA